MREWAEARNCDQGLQKDKHPSQEGKNGVLVRGAGKALGNLVQPEEAKEVERSQSSQSLSSGNK